MPVSSSPSDYTTINPNYGTGNGFYTDIGAVSDLLQVTPFTSGTNPSAAQVGSIIKRIEGMVDGRMNLRILNLLAIQLCLTMVGMLVSFNCHK